STAWTGYFHSCASALQCTQSPIIQDDRQKVDNNYRLLYWVLLGGNVAVSVLPAASADCQTSPFPTIAFVNGNETSVVLPRTRDVAEVVVRFHVCAAFDALPRLAGNGGMSK